MNNDWDLYAVVKGCTTAAATTTTTISSSINMVPSPEDPFVTLGYMSPSFLDDDTNINFPTTTQDKPVEPFDGLEEFCNEFRVGPTTDVHVGQTPVFSSQHHSQQPQEIPQIQQQQMNPFVGCSLSFQTTNSQPLRPRRRKNQQMKVVQQMTQEELSADSWAWRKYGQKPIKGSPYPRNYYRCSTSKACGARKHVERSPTNPAIFVVSYSGEHAHRRPIQRSSLSGTTRTKFSSVTTSGDPTNTTTSNTSPIAVSNSSCCSSSSLASCSSFSPNTPIMEGEKPERNDDFEMVEQLEVEDEDEDILFSNEFMSEEIFKVHQELSGINNGSSGYSSGGDVLSSGLLSPPWSLSSSAAFNAGGSCAD